MVKNPQTPSIKPLHDFVLVRPANQEDRTASGIILPDSAKEKPQVGEVMAVGPGKFNEDGDKRIAIDLKIGQKVLYKKWGGNEIKVGQEDWMLIEQNDVMAIVE